MATEGCCTDLAEQGGGSGIMAEHTDNKSISKARKTYWRSASCSSRSAPTSPMAGVQTSTCKDGHMPQPCCDKQGSRARSSLPPLKPLAIAPRSSQEWPQAAVDDMDDSDWVTPATPGHHQRLNSVPDMKLDLASVHRAPLEPTNIQLKRNKLSFFDKECSRVGDYHVYLGSDAVARNRETLRAHGITHVLNCVGFRCPEYFKNDFTYKTLWLQDSPGEDITSLLYDVFDYFEEVGELGGRVFVHCCQGVSRSTSLVIAYMMWRECRSFEEAFQDVKASRGVTNPNMGFACQLLQCQKRVHATPMSPTSVLRMYRVAPHSPYDPLHLVPKEVKIPGAGALDSRGAFIIHMPQVIYVWIGCGCDPKIAMAAIKAAAQVVRYERVQGQTCIVAEGTESDEFWESLGKYGDLVDETSLLEFRTGDASIREGKKKAVQEQLDRVRNVGAGNKKVPSYSADFELYQRARQGGVVPPMPSSGASTVGSPTRIPEREDGWGMMLRRKFLSGEFSSAVEPDALYALPSPSVSSSSPLFSPFSATTASSSTGTGGDSVSASPLSHLSLLSPDSAFCASPEVVQPGPGNEWTSSNLSSLHRGHQNLFPLNRQSLPPDLGSKSPAESLARRRGASTVQHLSLDDMGENVPSRKTKLPLLSLINEELKQKSEGNEGAANNPSGQATGMMEAIPDLAMIDADVHEEEDKCMDASPQDSRVLYAEEAPPAADHGSLLASNSAEFQHPVLFAWPQFERLDKCSADILSSKGVFLLWVPQAAQNRAKFSLYIWVGSEQDEHMGADDFPWKSIGLEFLKQWSCFTNTTITVVRQGSEPAEFWRNFPR